MTTAWVLKSAITNDDLIFTDSCGILSEIKEFGKHPNKKINPAGWWQNEYRASEKVTHTMRIFFYATDDKESLLLQLRYCERLMLANEHWTRGISGVVVIL